MMEMLHCVDDLTSSLPARAGSNLIFDELCAGYSDHVFQKISKILHERFGLKLRTSNTFPYGIKAIIRGRSFDYLHGICDPTKLFMLLHTLGHYQFISRAAQLGIDRYDYIYETSDDGDAHVYRYRAASANGTIVTPKILRDRIEFEIRANDFAVETAKSLALTEVIPLIRLYEPADIRYIIDVMNGGPDAIVSDRRYVENYVLSGIQVFQEENVEKIFDRSNFEVDNIDWNLIEKRKIEIHFL